MPSEGEATRVFINCPYDVGYLEFMRALIFVIHDCGFEADYALRDGNGTRSRLEQIVECLDQSHISVHDISAAESFVRRVRRTRMNMSFECGLAFGIGYSSRRDNPDRSVLVLTKTAEDAAIGLSDLAGCNPAVYNGQLLDLVMKVRQFLARKHPNPHEEIRDHHKLLKRFRSFDQHLRRKCGHPLANSALRRRRPITTMPKKPKVSYRNLMTIDYIRDWHMAAVVWIATHQN